MSRHPLDGMLLRGVDGNYYEIENDFPPRSSGDRRSEAPRSESTEWGALARGKTLGKKANVIFQSAGGLNEFSPVNVLELRGDDDCALPLSLLLSPPRVINDVAITPGMNVQNLSGSTTIAGGTNVTAANPIAKVEWGIGGVAQEAICDIHQGLALNLSASFLRLSVAVEEVDITATSEVYELSAFIGPGMPKTIGGATRTIVIGNVANGVESGVFVVPNFARRVYVCASAGAGGGVPVLTIRFYRSGAPGDFTAEYIFASNSPSPIPIPNGSYFFTVTPGFAGVKSISTIFDLAI